MNFREKKNCARSICDPKLRIAREREKGSEKETINICGQRTASIFRIPAPFLRSDAYVCVHALTYTRIRRFIARVTSRFTIASPRVVSCAYRNACVVRSLFLSSLPLGLLGSPYSVFFFFFRLRHCFPPRCATNFGYVRRKRPWSHAAIGRAQRKHDR